MSQFLISSKPLLKLLVSELSKEYEYVSVLGTDTKGKNYDVRKAGIEVNDSFWNERGFVVRVFNGVGYSEVSFNNFTKHNIMEWIEEIKNRLKEQLEVIKRSSIDEIKYPLVQEEKIERSYFGEVEILPEEVSSENKIERMKNLMNIGLRSCEFLIDLRISYKEVHISKIFISNKKELEQAYIWSEGYIIPLVRREDNTKYSVAGYSGLKAVELLDEMEHDIEKVINEAVELLDASSVKPGDYDVICSPEVVGVIAHEAFGHGVEMDMFVKKRAKAEEYLNKQVASSLVTMHDGASAAKHVSAYLFDDEGTLATDTEIIKAGILNTGISDLLSAMKLGTVPTGNGKRQSFERKAYSRMTHTFFTPGKDKLEDMIASIQYGYLLEGIQSGMEDPKNWGIQCMLTKGREIENGKFTGKIVAPVILTGYVPDLLNSISMVSGDFRLFGTGMCGKGYKELVKACDGGPYVKAKARLG
jgi:TldD protein